MLQFIELNPKRTAKSCVIWLHGLGADGNDFVDIVPQLNLPDESAIRFIFPHAPIRKVTWAGNMPMRAWFDVYRIDRALEDERGIQESQILIDELIAAEVARGIPASNIVLAGFSQGGAMTLQCGLRYPSKLAGMLVLSGWLPLAKTLAFEKNVANQNTPILLQHGSRDDLIPLAWAEDTYKYLIDAKYPVRFDTYPMQHAVCADEIATLGAWLRAVKWQQ